VTDGAWIAVEGLIGAGKTTTANLLAERLGAQPLLERVAAHPLLPRFYEEPDRFALETELVFMALRLHEAKAVEPGESVVSDFTPAKTSVFASVNVSDKDACLIEVFEAHVWEDLARPGIAVFLDVPPKVCLARIRARGREFEQGLAITYLEALRAAYFVRLDALAASVITLELDGSSSAEEVTDAVAASIAGVQADERRHEG
jgi:deoxyadenosine/deoxycytidine kinase